MSRIRGRNTKPELILKKMLDSRVFKYQPQGITGNPDFANKRRRIAVFIDGCFWHGCPRCYKSPKSNKRYWLPKIGGNIDRDKEYSRALRKSGWKVLRFWEHSVLRNPEKYASIAMKETE